MTVGTANVMAVGIAIADFQIGEWDMEKLEEVNVINNGQDAHKSDAFDSSNISAKKVTGITVRADKAGGTDTMNVSEAGTAVIGNDAYDMEADSNQKSGHTYSYNDQELIRQLTKSRMEQKQPLEYEDLDGYELPPRSQFSMLKKPAVSIKYGKLTFNMACIRMFEGVQYILPLCHPRKKRLTVVMCREEEAASVDWARVRQKDGIWVNKDISSPEYVDKLYKMMGWNRECRYKVLGRVANSMEGLVLVFDLEEAVMYESRSMKVVDEITGKTQEKKKQIAYYPEMYKECIGKTYNDYTACRQINMFEYLEEYVGNTYGDYVGSAKEKKQEISASSRQETAADSCQDMSTVNCQETLTASYQDTSTALHQDTSKVHHQAHHIGSLSGDAVNEKPTEDVSAFNESENIKQEEKVITAVGYDFNQMADQASDFSDGQLSFDLDKTTTEGVAEEKAALSAEGREPVDTKLYEERSTQEEDKTATQEGADTVLKAAEVIEKSAHSNGVGLLQPKRIQNYDRNLLMPGINSSRGLDNVVNVANIARKSDTNESAAVTYQRKLELSEW